MHFAWPHVSAGLCPRLPVPPLGPLNWKQGKIGIGALLDATATTFRYRALPGGGAGFYPATGKVLARVLTAPTFRVELQYLRMDGQRVAIVRARDAVVDPQSTSVVFTVERCACML